MSRTSKTRARSSTTVADVAQAIESFAPLALADDVVPLVVRGDLYQLVRDYLRELFLVLEGFREYVLRYEPQRDVEPSLGSDDNGLARDYAADPVAHDLLVHRAVLHGVFPTT